MTDYDRRNDGLSHRDHVEQMEWAGPSDPQVQEVAEFASVDGYRGDVQEQTGCAGEAADAAGGRGGRAGRPRVRGAEDADEALAAQRREAILRLLDTRNDNLPEPRGPRGSHVAGFAHGKAQLSCPDCLANGRRMIHCETCGGAGTITVDRRDPYMEMKTVAYGLDGAVHDRTVAIDDAIRVAGRELQRFGVDRPRNALDEIAEADKHPDPWQVARDRMYRLYDYAPLERALDELAKTLPDISPRSPEGLAFIDARMPDPIRAPRQVNPADPRSLPSTTMTPAEVKRLERINRIRSLSFDGLRPDEIAVEVRCSLATVYRALQEATEEAA